MTKFHFLFFILLSVVVGVLMAACSSDGPESTIDSDRPESTVDSDRPGSTVDSDRPESTVDEVKVTLMDPGSVTETHATLNAETNMPVTEDADILFGFIYAQEEENLFLSNPQIQKFQTRPEDTSGKFTCIIEFLKPATKYYYRAFASKNGTVCYSSVKNFTTLDFVASVFTDNTDNITVPKADLHGSLSVTSVEIFDKSVWFLYSATADNLEALMSSGNRVDAMLADNGSFVASASNLGYSMTYHYAACAMVHDRTIYGEVKTFQTGAISSSTEAVDMGLSIKWAPCDLGADSPEKKGDAYAWGETETKQTYSWDNYKWGSYNTLTKYNNYFRYGIVDNKAQLELDDDAAHAKLGGKWRMPTREEYQTLEKNCEVTLTEINNVPGYLYTSKINGNSIFFYGGNHCWTSTLSEDSLLAYPLFYGDPDTRYAESRCEGHQIRPVLEVD